MNTKILSGLVGACLASSLAMGAEPAVLEGTAAIENWARCGALLDLAIPPASIGTPTDGARVTKAELIPSGGMRYELVRDAEGHLSGNPVSPAELNPYGEYCLVEGEIRAAVPNTSSVIFHLALPSRWNGKSLQIDGRGNNTPPSPINFIASVMGIAPPLPIARGYAVYTREWGPDDHPFHHGERSKQAHDAAMFVIRKLYGKAPRHRYYFGAGGTGYESVTLIQRYPQDYDGVLTLCPYFSITSLLHGQLIRRAIESGGGAGEITPVKAAFLRRKVLASCDKLDGLEDGIISNVEGCRFDFSSLRCPRGKDSGGDCFSDAQLKTLQVLHTSVRLPYVLPSGETHLPAFSIGADWDSVIRSDPANKAGSKGGEGPIRELFLDGDSAADVLRFDPLAPGGTVLARIQALSRSYDRSAPAIDLFIARGGKWILTHGWADDLAAPLSSIEHYRRLAAKYGQARMDGVMRLYLIPGYAHSFGVAFNGNGAPNLEALEDWVERGIAPHTLTVVDTNPGAKGRSRPMCVYPGWPRYNGSGDPDLATSFSCVTQQ